MADPTQSAAAADPHPASGELPTNIGTLTITDTNGNTWQANTNALNEMDENQTRQLVAGIERAVGSPGSLRLKLAGGGTVILDTTKIVSAQYA